MHDGVITIGCLPLFGTNLSVTMQFNISYKELTNELYDQYQFQRPFVQRIY